MKRYTEEDVERLVEASKVAIIAIPSYMDITRPNLQAALQPFLPDPEDELIEEMAKAYTNELADQYPGTAYAWALKSEPAKEATREAMRAALVIAKSKGWRPLQ